MKSHYNMYEAKTRLSEIVSRVRQGEEVILMSRGRPVARVVALEDSKPVRQLGFAKDIEILEGFAEIPEGFEDYL